MIPYKLMIGMTSLEMWALGCVGTVFGTLLTYAIILGRDQMIIQGVLNAEGELEEEEVNNRKKPRSAWSDSNIYMKVSLPKESLELDFHYF